MTILGIHDGHNSGATLIKDGKILYSILEERITRVKNEIGSIFRGMNLGFAKSKIDEMQRHAETETLIPSPYNNPRRKKNISII